MPPPTMPPRLGRPASAALVLPQPTMLTRGGRPASAPSLHRSSTKLNASAISFRTANFSSDNASVRHLRQPASSLRHSTSAHFDATHLLNGKRPSSALRHSKSTHFDAMHLLGDKRPSSARAAAQAQQGLGHSLLFGQKPLVLRSVGRGNSAGRCPMPSVPLVRPSVPRMAPPVSRPANPSWDLLPRDQPATGLAARSSTQDLRIDPGCYGQGTSGEPSPPFLRHSPEGPGTGPTVRYCNTNAWHSSPAGSSVCEGSVSLSGSTTVSPTRATIEVHLPPTVRQSPLLVSCRHCSGSPEPQLTPVGWQSSFQPGQPPTAASASAETSPPHPSPPLQSPALRPQASAVWGASPVQPRSPQNSPPSPPSPVQPRVPQSSPQSSPEPAARSPQSSPHSSQSPVQPPSPVLSVARGQSPAQTAGGGSCAAACAAGLGEDSHAPPRTCAAADAQDWDARQVAVFVSSLGAPLCQHAAAFLANGVTGARLGVLRADELPQLGVRRFEDILALLSHIRARLELPPPPPREPMRCAAASALLQPPPSPPQPQPQPQSLPPRKARFDEQRYRELHEQIAREADLLSRSPPKMSLHQLKTIQPLLAQGGGALGSQTVACLLQRLRGENSTKSMAEAGAVERGAAVDDDLSTSHMRYGSL